MGSMFLLLPGQGVSISFSLWPSFTTSHLPVVLT